MMSKAPAMSRPASSAKTIACSGERVAPGSLHRTPHGGSRLRREPFAGITLGDAGPRRRLGVRGPLSHVLVGADLSPTMTSAADVRRRGSPTILPTNALSFASSMA
jgi:hypothetical protein